MSEVAIAKEDDCWTLTLQRPQKANALSAGLVETLIAAVEDAGRQGVAVLALRGSGKNLSAGFDFAGYQDEEEAALVQRFVRIETLLQALATSPCLTVGFAHGRNFGAGVDLFAACRWRIAAPEATFRMPGLAFGLVLGTRRFAALVGREKAREILEGLQTFGVEAARDMGFVTSVSGSDDWAATIEQARRTAALLPAASRRALYETLDPGTGAADMEALVKSAAVPGLKARIAAYLSAP